MPQKLILENSAHDFQENIDDFFDKGYHVVPGTAYISHVEHTPVPKNKTVERIPYFFVVLAKHSRQVAISAMNSETFHGEVNKAMKDGYDVVPGTIYVTTLRTCQDKKLIELVFSVTVERSY